MTRCIILIAILLSASITQASPYCADLLSKDTLPKKYKKSAPIYSDTGTGWIFTQDQLKERYDMKSASRKLVQAIADEFAKRDVPLAIVVAPPRPVIAGQGQLDAAMGEQFYDVSAARTSFGALITGLVDFAGYSAMAIGLGLMIGFHFPENFNAPYVSQSITEFWRRWHISLSRWLRDYLYVPLGGNRGGKVKTYRNLLLTMVLGGIWHGANWTFVIWGMWHGGLMAIERALGAKHRTSVWPKAIAWPLTMLFVILGWVVFRAETLSDAAAMYAGMIGANGVAMRPELVTLTAKTELIFLLIGTAVSIAPRLTLPRIALSPAFQSAALSLLCFVALQARSNSPFLYFQF